MAKRLEVCKKIIGGLLGLVLFANCENKSSNSIEVLQGQYAMVVNGESYSEVLVVDSITHVFSDMMGKSTFWMKTYLLNDSIFFCNYHGTKDSTLNFGVITAKTDSTISYFELRNSDTLRTKLVKMDIVEPRLNLVDTRNNLDYSTGFYQRKKMFLSQGN